MESWDTFLARIVQQVQEGREQTIRDGHDPKYWDTLLAYIRVEVRWRVNQYLEQES